MKLAPFRAVIFDCDGVLVDSEVLGLRSLRQALREVEVVANAVQTAALAEADLVLDSLSLLPLDVLGRHASRREILANLRGLPFREVC